MKATVIRRTRTNSRLPESREGRRKTILDQFSTVVDQKLIKEAMASNRYRWKSLSAKIGVSIPRLRSVVNGKSAVKLFEARRMGEALDLEVNEMFPLIIRVGENRRASAYSETQIPEITDGLVPDDAVREPEESAA